MESLAGDLRTMVRTPLFDSHVERLHEVGQIVAFEEGDWLFELGAPTDTFYYVLEGCLEAVDPGTGERYGAGTLGPTQFVGEIAFLTGSAAMLGVRVVESGRAIAVPRERMLRLMSEIPEMSDIIVMVYAARRRALLESNRAGLTLIGIESDRDLRTIAAFASRNKIPYRDVPLGSEEARAFQARCGVPHDRPAVVFGASQLVEPPTPRRVARLFGLDLCTGSLSEVEVLIVGGGPAGVAAGVYAGSEGLKALVVEDLTVGGQAGTSSRIENYLGFPTGISGADLVWRGEVQALRFGTRFAVPRRVTSLERLPDGRFRAMLNGDTPIVTRSVVVATGVQYRRLPIEDLEAYEGSGVYYAATETEARYCRDAEVYVVGGGNSAGQAAMYLCRSAAHVHVLVRGQSLAASMSDYLSSRLEADPAITIHYGHELVGLHGEDHQLQAVSVRDKATDDVKRAPACAVFVMVGAAPNTGWLADLVALDERGFVQTGEHSQYATSQPGIFAVGDVRAGSVKRVASAVGEGSVVISEVWRYLNPA
jgi:thioredoxin reductase (NADPH)